MRINIETEFNIGDRVYHKLPESPMGIVTGINYAVSTGSLTYYVTYDPLQNEMQCFEWELTREKTMV